MVISITFYVIKLATTQCLIMFFTFKVEVFLATSPPHVHTSNFNMQRKILDFRTVIYGSTHVSTVPSSAVFRLLLILPI